MASFSKALAAAALSAVLVGCVGGGGGSETIKTNVEATIPEAVKTASSNLKTAQAALSSTNPTTKQVEAVEKAINDLKEDIKDLSSNEKQQYQEQIIEAQSAVSAANKKLLGQTETDKQKAEADKKKAEADKKKAEDDKKKEEADKKKAEADKKKAEDDKKKEEAARKKAEDDKKKADDARKKAEDDKKKLDDARKAKLVKPTYDALSDGGVLVYVGTDGNTVEEKDDQTDLTYNTNLPSLSNWEGKEYTYTDPTTKATYEARVYSYVGDPIPGNKFAYPDGSTTHNDADYQYGELDAEGYVTFGSGEGQISVTATYISGGSVFVNSWIGGNKTFPLNPPNTTYEIPGNYHGVLGTYLCTPATDQTCNASSLGKDKGFTLAGGTWKFKPNDPENNVSASPDTEYPSYGYWMKKDNFGKPLSIKSFIGFRGTQPAINTTNMTGSARYVGSAIGQFAILTNENTISDSGQFTATATLDAHFGSGNHTIDGTISNFNGPSDGRFWKVRLESTGITKTSGAITAGDTTWWIKDEAAETKTDKWYGQLNDIDTDTLPKAVSARFYAEYANPNAKMVGALGAEKQ